MSQQVQIDYKHIACQCNTVCNMAEQRLKELDEMLSQIENTATRLLNDQTENLKAAIVKEKESLIKQIKVMRNMKRTKKAQELVDMANKYFRDHNVKDEHSSDLFWFVCDYLLSHKMYRGYNFHNLKIKEDGTEVYPLAGTADKNKYDFIQIW